MRWLRVAGGMRVLVFVAVMGTRNAAAGDDQGGGDGQDSGRLGVGCVSSWIVVLRVWLMIEYTSRLGRTGSRLSLLLGLLFLGRGSGRAPPLGLSPRSSAVDGRVAQAGPYVPSIPARAPRPFPAAPGRGRGLRQVMHRSKSWDWRVSQW